MLIYVRTQLIYFHQKTKFLPTYYYQISYVFPHRGFHAEVIGSNPSLHLLIFIDSETI